jgi:hypothetical protein
MSNNIPPDENNKNNKNIPNNKFVIVSKPIPRVNNPEKTKKDITPQQNIEPNKIIIKINKVESPKRKPEDKLPFQNPKKHRFYDDMDDYSDLFAFMKQYETPQVVKETKPEPVIDMNQPVEIISKKINNLSDLIEIGKTYDISKRYNIDLVMLNKITPVLEELNSMIGMKQVKRDIIDHVLFYLQKLDCKNKDMLHTVIMGAPGVGKTQLGQILGKLYSKMGFLKKNIFKKASRADMVGKYLGHTAIKTEELIDSCMGGVLFIDEIYSLGNKEQKDSFSKEAIDTLNLKLSEHKNEFVCIVAGYAREVEECFFAYNPGLSSRFPIRFTIDSYNAKELYQIFCKIVKDNDWTLSNDVDSKFFKDNYNSFKYFGRDMDNLFLYCKRSHSRNLFYNSTIVKKELTLEDLQNGYDQFVINRPTPNVN